MTINSAHEDISILNDSLEEIQWIQDVSAKQLFSLLKKMEDAFARGSAGITKQVLCLQSTNGEANARVELHQIDSPGWFSSELHDLIPELSNEEVLLSVADLQAIKSGEYEIEFSLHNKSRNLSVDELLNQMDVFGIGRPSTYASVLHELETELAALDLDPDTGDVKLTQRGILLSLKLRALAGDLARFQYSATITGLCEEVEKKLSPLIPILMVYEDIFGFDARRQIEHIEWKHINDLYREKSERKRSASGLIAKNENGVKVLPNG